MYFINAYRFFVVLATDGSTTSDDPKYVYPETKKNYLQISINLSINNLIIFTMYFHIYCKKTVL